jgi:hypothetical protein
MRWLRKLRLPSVQGFGADPQPFGNVAYRVTTLKIPYHSVPFKLIRKSSALVNVVSPRFQNYQAKHL